MYMSNVVVNNQYTSSVSSFSSMYGVVNSVFMDTAFTSLISTLWSFGISLSERVVQKVLTKLFPSNMILISEMRQAPGVFTWWHQTKIHYQPDQTHSTFRRIIKNIIRLTIWLTITFTMPYTSFFVLIHSN